MEGKEREGKGEWGGPVTTGDTEPSSAPLGLAQCPCLQLECQVADGKDK